MKATKKLSAVLATLVVVAIQSLSAQSIKTPAFTQPLVEQWVKVYNESHPDQRMCLAGKGMEADIQIVVSHQQSQNDQKAHIAFGRYAILPFAATGGEAARVFGNKKLSKNKLEQIFFELDEEDDEFGESVNANRGMTIYTGISQATISNSFAEYFGQPATAYRGKKIQGDDRFVNMAVAKDQKGLAFNALSNLFDLQNRQLKEGIQILGLDVDKTLQAAVRSNNLDELINALENEKASVIATSDISLSYDENNAQAAEFVNWVTREGIAYNHQYGLLNNNQKSALQANNK